MTVTSVVLRGRSSFDRKVDPVVRRQGSKDAPVLGNTYGLPAGLSCPGRTAFCDGCYAERTERVFTSSGRLVAANWAAHQAAEASDDPVSAHVSILSGVVGDFAARAVKHGHRARDAAIFRIHWDGDFFSAAYAEAWAQVCAAFPQIRFWAYTRSFDFVDLLADVPNLTLYLSVDAYNCEQAGLLLDIYPSLRAAFCADTQADASVLADKVGRSAAPCPENVGRIPLVMSMSGRRTEVLQKGADGQGACAACRLCVDGVRDVSFAVKGR